MLQSTVASSRSFGGKRFASWMVRFWAVRIPFVKMTRVLQFLLSTIARKASLSKGMKERVRSAKPPTMVRTDWWRRALSRLDAPLSSSFPCLLPQPSPSEKSRD